MSMFLFGIAPGQSQIIGPHRTVAASFSKDGMLAAFSRANALVLVDPTDWKIRWSATAQNGNIVALAFSQDGRRLAAATQGSSGPPPNSRFVNVEIFEIATGELENVLVNEKVETVKDLSYTPDGSLLAVATHADAEILLWDVTRDQTVTLARRQRITYCTAVFSTSGALLTWAINVPATPYPEFEIQLFDTVTRSATSVIARGSTPMRAIPLAFSQDGSKLAFAIEAWNPSDMQPTQIGLFDVVSRKVTRKIKTAAIDVYSLIFSADGRNVLATGLDFILRNNPSHDRDFDPATPAYRIDRLCLWDTASGKLQRELQRENKPGASPDPIVQAIRAPRQDTYVFITSMGSLYFYNSISLQPNAVIPSPFANKRTNTRAASDARDLRYTVSARHILALSFGTYGRIFAADSAGSVYSLSKVQGPELRGVQLNPESELLALAPDGQTMAVLRRAEAGVAILDADSGKTVRELGDSRNKLHANSESSGPRSKAASDKKELCQLQPAVCRDSPPRTATERILLQSCVVATGIPAHFWHTSVSGSG
jgi:WD40 repeat protein